MVLLSTIQAAYSGFFQEAFQLVGLVVGYLVAAWQYQRLAGWFESYLKSAWLAESAGFLIIFFAVAVAAGIAGQTARWVMKKSGLSFLDRLLGGALGLLRGCLIVAVIVVSMTAFTPTSKWLAGFGVGPVFPGGGASRHLGRARGTAGPVLPGTGFAAPDAADSSGRRRSASSSGEVGSRKDFFGEQADFDASDSSRRKRDAVRDQLEALIMQMYRSNILYSEAVREFKKKFILTVLQENKGNQCRAARELGMHRNTLSRTIAELKIDVRQLRDGVKRPPRSARPVSYEKKAAR